jgi:hypothetical protein
MTTATATHTWVKWSLTAMDVIVDPFTGVCSAVETPDEGVGEQVCCHHCGEPLTDSSAVTPCGGSIEPALP